MQIYYCPYCGSIKECSEEMIKSFNICDKCFNDAKFTKAKHDKSYYKEKAQQKYGEHIWWVTKTYDILLNEEIINNPLYNEIYVNQSKETQSIINNRISNPSLNKPKCPTCNSTNIENISFVKRVAHAYTFGLFSKTARSQFYCKNCGYKW